MRFTTFALSAVLAAAPALAFQPSIAVVSRTTLTQSLLRMSAVEQTDEKKATKKEERLRFMKSDNFYRKGFKEVREAVEDVMGGQFKSSTVDELKSSNYVMERDGVKVYLAKVRTASRCANEKKGIDPTIRWGIFAVRSVSLPLTPKSFAFLLSFFVSSPHVFTTNIRTLDSAGASNARLRSRTKPSNTFPIAKFTLPTNSFTIPKSMTISKG
jgi:hypothetical protein